VYALPTLPIPLRYVVLVLALLELLVLLFVLFSQLLLLLS
jgi:hypothetical protein